VGFEKKTFIRLTVGGFHQTKGGGERFSKLLANIGGRTWSRGLHILKKNWGGGFGGGASQSGPQFSNKQKKRTEERGSMFACCPNEMGKANFHNGHQPGDMKIGEAGFLTVFARWKDETDWVKSASRSTKKKGKGKKTWGNRKNRPIGPWGHEYILPNH